MRIWTMAAIGALAFCATTATAQAASIGRAANALKATAGPGVAEKIAYRRCWRRNGVRYCRRFRSAYYPYYGVYPSNQPYPSGSSIGVIMGIR